MSCCGRGNPMSGPPYAAGRFAVTPTQPKRYSHVFFEYIGPTALTAVGRTTGKTYRFDRPGARVAVDPTDQTSLAGVPHLRIVFGP